MTDSPHRWLTIRNATDLMNDGQLEGEHISQKTARRRLAALDAEARRAGCRILRRFGPRTTRVNADALLAMLRSDTSLLEQEVQHLHARFDVVEQKTTRNRQGIKELRKQLRDMSERLDRLSRRAQQGTFPSRARS